MSISKGISIIFLLFVASFSAANGTSKTCKVQHLCFALDDSGSLRKNFFKVQSFTVNTVKEVSKNSTTVSYSAYAFSVTAQLIQSPTKGKNDFINAINNYKPRFGGFTNIFEGVKACFDELKGKNGDRVIVLVTDGKGTSPLSLKPEIEAAGIGIVTVGIGSNLNFSILKKLATKPEFFVQTYLNSLIGRSLFIAKQVCDVTNKVKESCQKAYEMCKFKFLSYNNNVPTFNIGIKPDVPFTTRIVSKKNPMIGVLNTNGIDAEFLNGTFKSITEFGDPTLTPTHFKPFSFPYQHMFSGIGHQTFTGDQLQTSKDKCVRVFFTSFQQTMAVYDGKKWTVNVVANVNDATKKDKYCVVFKTSK